MTSTRSTVITQQLEINKLKAIVERQLVEITELRAENEQLKAADAEQAKQLLQMRAADNARGIELNKVKEQSISVQQSADQLVEKHDFMKEWYDSRNPTLVDGFNTIKNAFEISRKRVNILWSDRCKEQEIQRKRDHDRGDPRNPDTSATFEQQGASASTQIIVYKPLQIGTAQGTSGGSKDELEKLESGHVGESSTAGENVVPSSADIALQVCPPIIREDLEDGEFISEMTDEHILALTDMKVVDDATIDETPSEPEVANLDGLDEIVFEGDAEKSKQVREDGTEFSPFDEEWLKDNMDEIDERLKNRDSSDVPADSFEEWRKNFLLKTAKPAPSVVQVDYMKYEKGHPWGRILSWMFVKDIHCLAVKREHGIQYFKSLLSILTLSFYDVAALAKLELINRSNYEGSTLFARKLRIERRKGWKDELYKP
ncbi:hypothetical protein HanRHA438_Chr10g0436161 [Helianthus annuus]|nr:hypothetical protein HanOQP8_Chr10g0352551 [Helianthus annuus]KAJ0878124.1 hypothetical protein HanRHA438_Chr10g0436161 [Helianthus annuus]